MVSIYHRSYFIKCKMHPDFMCPKKVSMLPMKLTQWFITVLIANLQNKKCVKIQKGSLTENPYHVIEHIFEPS